MLVYFKFVFFGMLYLFTGVVRRVRFEIRSVKLSRIYVLLLYSTQDCVSQGEGGGGVSVDFEPWSTSPRQETTVMSVTTQRKRGGIFLEISHCQLSERIFLGSGTLAWLGTRLVAG